MPMTFKGEFLQYLHVWAGGKQVYQIKYLEVLNDLVSLQNVYDQVEEPSSTR